MWVYTAAEHVGGDGGRLSLMLSGALGDAWLMHLDRVPPAQGRLFAPGGYCELFCSEHDVGTLQKLTVPGIVLVIHFDLHCCIVDDNKAKFLIVFMIVKR